MHHDHQPHDPRELLRWELAQRRESGFALGDLAEAGQRAADGDDPAAARGILDELYATSRDESWAYEEPEGLEAILASLPDAAPVTTVGGAELSDRMLGAWLGRCAGCNLGKPVESGDHWTAGHLRTYLQLADAYPLRDYVPVLDPMPEGFELREFWPYTTRGRITESARDDDIDYTILGLHLIEEYGLGFTTADVAREWLDRLPYTQTFTAERVAYRNLAIGHDPSQAGQVDNPYREWIGAQIRADIFGYVHPGDPRAAAELAYRDAALSHSANGVYGEMWSAALVAAAFTGTARQAVEASLTCIPPGSRLAEAIRFVLDRYAAGDTWEEARAAIGDRYGHYSWVHTVNNAALVTAGLLWGDGDFTATIGLTVQGGWDTDSNGATAGSVAGIVCGAQGIPPHWVEPFHDTARSAIRGFDRSRISDLAERTVRLVTNR
ncbi:ADP-ribosylglycohydrolase family protein [Streptomyces sp. NPDC059477]|uniref:ADP-ribosylglycohydrolase family protein n=1 Tax=Streptomyces sp. NPDC059477 TaxID=3346847 RepID=UPI0036CE500D